MRTIGLMMALVLGLPAMPVPAQNPWTEVDVDPAILDAAALVYSSAEREVVFCIDGAYDPDTDTFAVDRLWLAPQQNNRTDSAEFDCTGAVGWVHNHADTGSRFCTMSEDDLDALRENPDMVLALGWCRDGAWFHAFGYSAVADDGG